MSFYRKKPVVIEAIKCAQVLSAYQHGHISELPAWVIDAYEKGVMVALTPSGLTIKTLEGDMKAMPSDMIIKGVNGELYPCKPDIFSETYEPA